jgi:hypothetical protein
MSKRLQARRSFYPLVDLFRAHETPLGATATGDDVAIGSRLETHATTDGAVGCRCIQSTLKEAIQRGVVVIKGGGGSGSSSKRVVRIIITPNGFVEVGSQA